MVIAKVAIWLEVLLCQSEAALSRSCGLSYYGLSEPHCMFRCRCSMHMLTDGSQQIILLNPPRSSPGHRQGHCDETFSESTCSSSVSVTSQHSTPIPPSHRHHHILLLRLFLFISDCPLFLTSVEDFLSHLSLCSYLLSFHFLALSLPSSSLSSPPSVLIFLFPASPPPPPSALHVLWWADGRFDRGSIEVKRCDGRVLLSREQRLGDAGPGHCPALPVGPNAVLQDLMLCLPPANHH